MDQKQGRGIYYFKDGKKYEGNWENGKQHGEGVEIYQNGSRRKGIW